MNKKLFVLICFFIIGIIGCKVNNNKPPKNTVPENASIAGNWIGGTDQFNDQKGQSNVELVKKQENNDIKQAYIVEISIKLEDIKDKKDEKNASGTVKIVKVSETVLDGKFQGTTKDTKKISELELIFADNKKGKISCELKDKEKVSAVIVL